MPLMALGSLIIQTRCGYTDRETVQQITENPYLQYFIGLKEYQLTPPFTPVALVKFRKRFKKDRLDRINERIVSAQQATEGENEAKDDDHDDPQGGSYPPDASKPEDNNADNATSSEPQSNQGMLILDATCIPADIKYPTDLGLLNDAREKLEEIIDTLHKANGKKGKKPRTYRENARKAYLSVSKQRSPRKASLRQGLKRQLQYSKRNLRHIDQMLQKGALGIEALSRR